MKLKTLADLLLVIAALLVVAVFKIYSSPRKTYLQTTSKTSGENQYKDNTYRFSLNIPRGWKFNVIDEDTSCCSKVVFSQINH